MSSIIKNSFGKTQEGFEVTLFTLTNKNQTSIGILDYGGTVVFWKTPDKNGTLTDIVLGYDSIEAYEKQDKYLGALIGRHGNRIAKGRFTLNEKEYQLYCNDGNNHLHGGKKGFDKKMWKAEIEGESLKLSCISPDGEEGYPGTLSVVVCYTLTEDNCLKLDYTASTDVDTVCNLTNHTYFNLAGHSNGSIENQKMQLFADNYTLTDSESLPNGMIEKVESTPMDFRELIRIGEHINDDFEQLKFAGGYDHNWVINDYDGTLKKAAFACDETTGITLTAFTTLPGIQFYTGNYLEGAPIGKSNTTYHKRDGFCLESQYFPNALEHKNFLQPILKKGETFHSTTIYQTNILK